MGFYLSKQVCTAEHNNHKRIARQALTVGLVRDQRRGLATSLNALSMQLPQSFGPTFAGFLFSTGQLVVPFILGAACQGVYLLLYGNFFRKRNEPAGMEN